MHLRYLPTTKYVSADIFGVVPLARLGGEAKDREVVSAQHDGILSMHQGRQAGAATQARIEQICIFYRDGLLVSYSGRK